ncbi:MAG: 23S rRNA (uracil(1939)-C(5))-methyltransferase RlmD [Chlorobi bacterium]|nr:23S rRNA (uracil(1939)-C(5))-methyltransferase RlmD [Chlorobiota bacterium]
MKRNDVLQLEIIDYAFEGKGIAKVDIDERPGKKFVVFVHGAFPGDIVSAQIIRKKKSYAEAKVLEVITPSEYRTEPKCVHFGICGGCKQQNLDYSAQLKFKQEQVLDVFRKIGGLENFEVNDILPSEHIFYYRNKMEFSFADKRWLTQEEISKNSDSLQDRNFALGLHIPRIYDKVLDINECYLQSEISSGILNLTRDFFKGRGTTIFTTKTHEGNLRNLVIKQSKHTDDLMVNLVTSDDNEELMKEYSRALLEKFPEITTIINNVNKKKSQTAFGDYEKVYHGEGVIYDYIGGYKFRISANSFFQTNTLQGERLYQAAADFAEFSKEDVVYDLYSGAGTITIFISKYVNKVYGFESVDAAVKDAEANVKENGIDNVNFFLADLNKSFSYLVEKASIPKPTVIIADPPRGGMNPRTVRDIARLSPPKVVYISCNPATQARDIALLIEAGYKLIKIRPVDMFPHTHHIENVALLIRK